MKNPPLTVVIPCYNHGRYILEALDSLKKCDTSLFEVIIVNDGSIDEYTNQVLDALQKEGYQIIFQQNSGLGQARNVGIQNAKGQFILPLDADNRIYPNYITKSLEIFEMYSDVAVVFGNANYIGDKTGVLKPGPYNLQKLMLGNYIDACAVIRRTALEEVGLYDNMKIMGFEDWDLWLRLGLAGYKFHYIDEVLFDYRVTSGSMMKALNADIKKRNEIEDYFLHKYKDQLDFDYVHDFFLYKIKKRPFSFLYRLVLKKVFPRYFEKLVRENRILKRFMI